MSKYWIDFQGYCAVDANSWEEAENLFYGHINPANDIIYDEVYEVQGIEQEAKEVSDS